jgi:hypothetical protein
MRTILLLLSAFQAVLITPAFCAAPLNNVVDVKDGTVVTPSIDVPGTAVAAADKPQIKAAAVHLTPGKLNAVRAAFKTGVNVSMPSMPRSLPRIVIAPPVDDRPIEFANGRPDPRRRRQERLVRDRALQCRESCSTPLWREVPEIGEFKGMARDQLGTVGSAPIWPPIFQTTTFVRPPVGR